jgi:hypothetical protein
VASVPEARKQIRELIDDSNPAESPTAYYVLFHPVEKSTLFTVTNGHGKTVGFVGRFQTGMDLFRPLVTLKAPSPEVAAQLLSKGLVEGRPYIFFAGLNQLAMIGGSLHIENQRILRIYTLDPARFSPQMNVMVQHSTAHDGTPRCEVKHENKTISVAGVNWKSPAFAEIYVNTEPIARQKGWGKAVVSGLTERLLKSGLRPIYLVENGNEESRGLIEGLGYYDTGSRQVYADTVYTGNPMD